MYPCVFRLFGIFIRTWVITYRGACPASPNHPFKYMYATQDLKFYLHLRLNGGGFSDDILTFRLS